MPNLNLFFALTKVDEAQRLVYGVATAEQPDKSGEICDYETTVPYYKAWSGEIEKATGGKSKGNVREMHSSNAVGKLTQINFNDEQKQIEICAKIVDDQCWNKVVEGVLTGFSQGGSYAKTWKDGEYTRYTADPAEVSVVDNPCLASASFEMIRANGATEMVKFNNEKIAATKVEQVWKATDGTTFNNKREVVKYQAEIDAKALAAPALVAAAEMNKILDDKEPLYFEKKEFSEAKRKEMAEAGTAMKDGSFPIESAKDVENAVHDWGRTGSKPEVKAHIIARAKAIGAEASLPDGWIEKKDSKEEKAAAIGELKKAFGDDQEVFDAAAAMDALRTIVFLCWNESEEVMRGDSEDAAQVAMLETAISKLKEFIASEIQEDDEPSDIGELAAAAGVDAELLKAHPKFCKAFAKRGRYSKGDAEKIGALCDKVDDMGDHVAKLGKMHKAMTDTHEEQGETTHAEGHAEMGAHLKKLGKHIEKMAGCHKDMEECAKGLGVGPEGLGGQDGEPKEPDANQKMVEAEAMQKALAESDAQKAVIKTLSDTLEALNKRLAVVESQPDDKQQKPALFAVNKSNEAQKKSEETPDDASPNIFGSGLSPMAARGRR